MNIMEQKRYSSGITLIALIITIVVMLILAGVTINLVISPDGLMSKAQLAKELTKRSEEEEKIKIALMEILVQEKGKDIPNEELKEKLEDILGEEFELSIDDENIIIQKDDEYSFQIDSKYKVSPLKKLEETIPEFFIFNTSNGMIEGINAEYLDGKTIKDEKYCKIVVPKKINDINVVSIGNNAFNGITNLKSVVMQEGISSIGQYAFNGCSSLSNIKLSQSLKTIGRNAFTSTNIKEIIIPEGTETLDVVVFSYCDSLTKVVIPSTVTSIGGNCFLSCSSITDVTVPLQYSVSGHFSASKEKITNLKLLQSDDKVTSLPTSICSGLTSIEEIKIPDGIEIVGGNSFRGCESLKEIILPDTVTKIDSYAFDGCSSLSNVKLSQSLKTIGRNAFTNTNIKEIIIPEGTETLDVAVFSYCDSLTKVVIPSTVTSIGGNCFLSCPLITDITIPVKYSVSGYFSSSKDKITNLKLLQSAETITTTFPTSSCSGLTNIEKIEIPDGIEIIGMYACSGCTLLKEITLPNSVTTINSYAFNGCSLLSNIQLPQNLKTVGRNAFTSTGLNEIVFPEGTESLDVAVFSYCESLKRAVIPSTLTLIGANCFLSCKDITIICKGSIPAGQAWGAINATVTTQ